MLIGIFCGGFSSEAEISMKSARTILSNFPKNHEGILVEVTRNGWFVHLENGRVPLDLNNCSYNKNDQSVKIAAALIYVHGDPGENGKLQAYFDLINVPVINASMLSSALSFDKWFCNQFLKNFGIPMADSIVLHKGESYNSTEIITRLSLPIFVKPTDSGSSYGISKVITAEDFDKAIAFAFAEGDTLVCEAFMNGIEVTCGTYQLGETIQTLPLTEIVSENDFFDYEAKYLGKSKEITPARVSNDVAEKIASLSKKIYKLLQIKSLSRIDFMIVNDEPMLIEVNTTPGFSPASIVPQQLACAGISIESFWASIFDDRLPKK
jgi:D-alanine-D-alanine ligase